jgi:hypothetical protein
VIAIDVADVSAVLVSGDWTNVQDVVVEFAEFTAGTSTWATGLYLAATIQGGPHNGDRVVVPLRSVDALRVAS